jgi:predicted nucleotidyltransferase
VRHVIGGRARIDGRTLREWVPHLVDDIVEAIGPEQVILFGSVARGDDGPDSDIDLIVLVSQVDPGEHNKLATRLRRAISAPIAINLLVADTTQFEARRDVIGSFAYWPAREGQVVYDRAA